MKFIHIADTHFDMPFKNISFKSNLGEERRINQREIFKKIINYIKENKINYFFISGDLYENEYIRKSTIEYINNLFKEIPDTLIFISPGNHDPYIKNSMYDTFDWNENVKIFSGNIERIETKECDIYGVGFTNFYADSLGVENIQIVNKNKINILIAHGSLNQSDKQEIQYNPINEKKLEKVGFDYIALGHIHKPYYNEKENQRIIYPGSTMSLGFDELGQHGCIYGELTKESIKLKFMPIDNKEFIEKDFCIDNVNDIEELIEKLNLLKLDSDKYYKIILVGKRRFEINILEINKFISNERIIKIKDNTTLNYELDKIENDNTLRGIFVKKLINSDYTEEEKNKILEIGFSALN